MYNQKIYCTAGNSDHKILTRKLLIRRWAGRGNSARWLSSR